MTEGDKKKTGKKLTGTVIKLSSDKTIKVRVEIKRAHPLYGKIVKKHSNYLVHNELEDIEVGDVVQIQEIRPISKNKKFILVKNIAK